MKTIFNCALLCVLFLFSGNLIAQDCTFYFPHKQGAEIVMKSFNEKDKLQSVSKSKVVEIEGNTIKIESEVFDEKEKPIMKSDYTVACKNGEFVMDLSNYLKGVDMEAYKNMDVKVETEDMHMPANLKKGDVLDDGQMTMKISNQGFTMMTIMVKVYNRKVEAVESITCPAGTFECAKITYDMDSKVGISTSGKGIEWVTKDVGVVRSESYNSKGKMQGYTVLASIK